VHQALDASQRMIQWMHRTVAMAKKCACQRPIGVTRSLEHASHVLVTVSGRIVRAAQQIEAMRMGALEQQEDIEDVPEKLVESFERCMALAAQLAAVANEVYALQQVIHESVVSGELVPERDSYARRPRIILAPRPVPLRAFLRRRSPRVRERIGPVLRRRWRIPRPASLRVPQRQTLGRAPPLSLVAAF
jgi:hypothetical protein